MGLNGGGGERESERGRGRGERGSETRANKENVERMSWVKHQRDFSAVLPGQQTFACD